MCNFKVKEEKKNRYLKVHQTGWKNRHIVENIVQNANFGIPSLPPPVHTYAYTPLDAKFHISGFGCFETNGQKSP